MKSVVLLLVISLTAAFGAADDIGVVADEIFQHDGYNVAKSNAVVYGETLEGRRRVKRQAVTDHGLTSEEIDVVVDEHNRYRRMEGASNMIKMVGACDESANSARVLWFLLPSGSEHHEVLPFGSIYILYIFCYRKKYFRLITNYCK